MAHPTEYREFCTIAEAAERSGLAPKTWYEGGGGTANVPRIRFGRAVRLRRADVERFINERISEAESAVGQSDGTKSRDALMSKAPVVTADE